VNDVPCEEALKQKKKITASEAMVLMKADCAHNSTLAGIKPHCSSKVEFGFL
jgi:hypothetical protein